LRVQCSCFTGRLQDLAELAYYFLDGDFHENANRVTGWLDYLLDLFVGKCNSCQMADWPINLCVP
jgi:hypothetical protein